MPLRALLRPRLAWCSLYESLPRPANVILTSIFSRRHQLQPGTHLPARVRSGVDDVASVRSAAPRAPSFRFLFTPSFASIRPVNTCYLP